MKLHFLENFLPETKAHKSIVCLALFCCETLIACKNPPSTDDSGGGAAQVSAPTNLGFGSMINQMPAACGPVTIQVQTSSGIPSIPAGNVSIALSTSAATGGFYTDAACTTIASTAQIGLGQGNVTVYYKDTAIGGPTLTARDASNILAPATTTATISATAPTSGTTGGAVGYGNKLAFATAPLNLAVSTCGAVTIQLQNSAGSPLGATTVLTVNFTSSAPTGAFYSNALCSTAQTSVLMAVGTNQITAYYRDSALGSPTLTAADPTGANAAGVQTATISTAGSTGVSGTQCWGAGGTSSAKYIFASSADASACARQIGAFSKTCKQNARYGTVSCPAGNVNYSNPLACACDSGTTAVAWMGQPSGI